MRKKNYPGWKAGSQMPLGGCNINTAWKIWGKGPLQSSHKGKNLGMNQTRSAMFQHCILSQYIPLLRPSSTEKSLRHVFFSMWLEHMNSANGNPESKPLEPLEEGYPNYSGMCDIGHWNWAASWKQLYHESVGIDSWQMHRAMFKKRQNCDCFVLLDPKKNMEKQASTNPSVRHF